MAVSYTIIQPLAPLTSFTVTPIAGGSQAANTYDFMAVVYDKSNPMYAASAQSPPIYCNNITFNGSQGAQFDIIWNASHTINQCCFIWCKKTGTNYWNGSNGGALCFNGVYNSSIINPATSKSCNYWTLTGYYGSCIAAIKMASGNMPYNLDTQKGCAVIRLTGNWGTTGNSIATIFSQIKTGGLIDASLYYYNNHNLFAGFVGIECAATGLTGTIDFTNMNIWVNAFDMGYRVTDGRNYTIKAYGNIAGDTTISCYSYAGSAVFVLLYKCDFKFVTISTGTQGITYYGQSMGSMQMSLDASTCLTNCRIHAVYPSITNANNYPNSVIIGQVMGMFNSSTYVEPLTIVGLLRNYYSNYTNCYKELTIKTNGTYTYGHQYTSLPIRDKKFLDCNFYEMDANYNTVIASGDYPPHIAWLSWNVGGWPATNIFIEHKVKLNIFNEEGESINDASIIMTDSSNNTYNFVNGVEQIIKSKHITHKNNPPTGAYSTDYMQITEYTPFTICISCAGYYTQNLKVNSLTEKLNWDIKMVYESVKIDSVIITDSQGVSDGSIQVNAESGNGPYQYSMNEEDWQDNNIFTGLPGGSYNIYVRDSKNTSDSISGIKVTQIAEKIISTAIILSELSGEISDNELEGDLVEISGSADLDITELSGEITQIQLSGTIEN